jgi:hypothetical protein
MVGADTQGIPGQVVELYAFVTVKPVETIRRTYPHKAVAILIDVCNLEAGKSLFCSDRDKNRLSTYAKRDKACKQVKGKNR